MKVTTPKERVLSLVKCTSDLDKFLELRDERSGEVNDVIGGTSDWWYLLGIRSDLDLAVVEYLICDWFGARGTYGESYTKEGVYAFRFTLDKDEGPVVEIRRDSDFPF